MKKRITILATIGMTLICGGCKFNELPPKTDDASKSYIKPAGEVPSLAERDLVNEVRTEYENATK